MSKSRTGASFLTFRSRLPVHRHERHQSHILVRTGKGKRGEYCDQNEQLGINAQGFQRAAAVATLPLKIERNA